MDVWIVVDESQASQEVMAVFAHAPSVEELASLGPLRQDFSAETNARGRSYTTRIVACWEVRA